MYIKIAYLFAIMACVANAASNDVIVDKLKLFVNGKEFFIKAMCYNPVPNGIKYMDAQGNNGGGLCSPKKTMWGDWKSACYDSDYFDGSGDDPARVPQGPSSWFKAAWDRDFPEIQGVGANTLRIYNSNPTTRQATSDPANGFPHAYGKNHIPFFDEAASYGFYIIFPLFGDYGYLVNTPAEEFKQYLRWQIDEVGNHSALLMFTLGNELNLYNNQPLIDTVNGYIAYAREYMLTKWGRTVPITTALVDLPFSYDTLVRDLDVDIFTTNAGYRGFDFSDLWTGNNDTQGLYKLSCTYNKPVFIGEIGWMSMNGDVNALYPNWANRIWKDLVNHVDAGCVGGAFFEYSNEPYSKSDVLQQHMGIVSLDVDGDSDQPNVFTVDKATHMPYLYDALASGTVDGVSYNMNADPFELLGRDPHTLSSAPDVCSGGFVTPTSPPAGATTTRAPTPTGTASTSTGGPTPTTDGSSTTPSNPGSSTPVPSATPTNNGGSGGAGSSTVAPTDSSDKATPDPFEYTTTSGASSLAGSVFGVLCLITLFITLM